jgi:hypothetical protein
LIEQGEKSTLNSRHHVSRFEVRRLRQGKKVRSLAPFKDPIGLQVFIRLQGIACTKGVIHFFIPLSAI